MVMEMIIWMQLRVLDIVDVDLAIVVVVVVVDSYDSYFYHDDDDDHY